jgi:hypothetical protein
MSDLTEDVTIASPLDDRDSEEPEYEVDPAFSCTNTNFGGEDPAKTAPKSEVPSEAATFDPRNNA